MYAFITDHVLEGLSTAKETTEANTNTLRQQVGDARIAYLQEKREIEPGNITRNSILSDGQNGSH